MKLFLSLFVFTQVRVLISKGIKFINKFVEALLLVIEPLQVTEEASL